MKSLAISRSSNRLSDLNQIARELKFDKGNLSAYLNGNGRLSAAKASELRNHLSLKQPLGGPAIAAGMAELLESEPESNLVWALAYRRLLGWSVIPLRPGTREGRVKWKPYQTMLPTEAEIRDWWTIWPNASVGLILGPLSGVFAIDVDNAEAQAALVHLIGHEPESPRQLSGSYSIEKPFKKHFLFKHPTEFTTSAKWEPLVKGLEFRGNRGLLVLARSENKDGAGRYEWEDGYAIWQRPLANIPGPIQQLFVDRDHSRAAVPIVYTSDLHQQYEVASANFLHFGGRKFSISTCSFVYGAIPVGERNNRLFAAAREMRDYGVPMEKAEQKLFPAAQRHGLEELESKNTIASAYSRLSRKMN